MMERGKLNLKEGFIAGTFVVEKKGTRIGKLALLITSISQECLPLTLQPFIKRAEDPFFTALNKIDKFDMRLCPEDSKILSQEPTS
jgi:hypothetical protein